MNFWNEHFENINWRLIWTYSNKYCINNKVYEIYFKIIHKIYPTNEFLKRYKNDLSELCTFCKKDTETVLHLFFECMFVRFFWIDVEYLFNMLSGVKICIGKRDVFFLIMVKKRYKQESNFYLKIYFETLKGLSNRKATRTMDIFKELNSSYLM